MFPMGTVSIVPPGSIPIPGLAQSPRPSRTSLRADSDTIPIPGLAPRTRPKRSSLKSKSGSRRQAKATAKATDAGSPAPLQGRAPPPSPSAEGPEPVELPAEIPEVTPLSEAQEPTIPTGPTRLETPWTTIYTQKPTPPIQLRHGVQRPPSETERKQSSTPGPVLLYTRLRQTRPDKVVADYCFSPPDPQERRFITCSTRHCGFISHFYDGENFVYCHSGLKTRIARWSVKKCLKAAMKHNARYECNCSLARLAGRQRESIPIYVDGDNGVSVSADGFEVPVGWTVGRKEDGGRRDSAGPDREDVSVVAGPSREAEDQEDTSVMAGPSREATDQENASVVVSSSSELAAVEKVPTRTCCDSGSAMAEVMAFVHGFVCGCDGLGRRVKW